MASHDDRKLTHLTPTGDLSMVDVGGKAETRREAVATARVRMAAETLGLLERQALPKGDVLAVSRVAAILAAKKTPELIPLTHALSLDVIEVDFEIDRASSSILVRSTVRCTGRTGVEIEAMTASVVAALTIYDMCKSADHGIAIEEVRLERKAGGKSGTWERTSSG